MSGQEITKEKIERLRKYIGKEVRINVHVDEATWEYGDIEHNEYDVSYRIILKAIDRYCIEGIMVEEKEWKHKGELITQPFKLTGKGFLPWEAGTNKHVNFIECLDEILYQR